MHIISVLLLQIGIWQTLIEFVYILNIVSLTNIVMIKYLDLVNKIENIKAAAAVCLIFLGRCSQYRNVL